MGTPLNQSRPPPSPLLIQEGIHFRLEEAPTVMAALLHAIFGMFKHDRLFDGSKSYALLEATTPIAQEAPLNQFLALQPRENLVCSLMGH